MSRTSLTTAERERAWKAGKARIGQLFAKGRRDSTHEEQAAIVGAEILVARLLNRDWRYDGGLGSKIVVRYDERIQSRLIVNDTDPDDGLLVFVVGAFPNYEVPGFIKVADARECSKRVELAKDWTPRIVEQSDLTRIVPSAGAPCATHRDFWRVTFRPDVSRAQGPGPWVCTVCHPPPFPDDWDMKMETGMTPAEPPVKVRRRQGRR